MTTTCSRLSGRICRGKCGGGGADFILGFGAEEQLEKVFPFRRPTQVRVTTPSFLLRAYCGCGHGLSSQSLPFTPVCCLTRTDRLREWLGELEEFTRGRPLREYFMMQRNAGFPT